MFRFGEGARNGQDVASAEDERSVGLVLTNGRGASGDANAWWKRGEAKCDRKLENGRGEEKEEVKLQGKCYSYRRNQVEY